jgi:hypothetical protein
MTGEQFASPPCFLHELDPEFREPEELDVEKVKKPVLVDKAMTDES